MAYTIVDAADYDELTLHRWCRSRWGYARRGISTDGRRYEIKLHRQLLGLKHGDGLQVDHINGDRLDNRRTNLRVVTHAQQGQNLPNVGRGRSEYRGVSFHKTTRRWRADVTVKGKQCWVGLFDTELEAAEAAEAFRRRNLPFATDRT